MNQGAGARHAAVPTQSSAETAKRLLDLLVTLPALIILTPVMIAVAIAIVVADGRPVLFRQERLGRDELPFVMLKFRTMAKNNDDAAHRAYVTSLLTEEQPDHGGEEGVYKLARDPRITRPGRVLRKTSLDELPQLFNVLRGEMSLVGPRPVLAWEAQLFHERHRQRFAVKPGVTGLWQVSGRNALTMQHALDLDVEYVRRRTLWLDLRILVRTIGVVLRGSPAH